jgi:TatA/E family protein of Tat protein translocase
MEFVLVVLVILLVFGVDKLPQVGGAIGWGIQELWKA